ncbi:MAG: aquaporin [Verrucomicrobiota bacterium]
MRYALRTHWPEYFMEAAELGIFMMSATLFTVLLYHPASPVVRALPPEFFRRVLMGLAMGLTLVGIVFSPWGKQSGAHMNPAFTLTFYWLGKVATWDAVFYVAAQFAGGVAGVAIVALFSGSLLAHPAVNYAPTIPGPSGVAAAFLGETVISFILVAVVLAVSNHKRLARFTGLFAGACVAGFIVFESPLSGMSMNPARTFGSAVIPGLWTGLWVYFLAPPLGMLAAAAAFKALDRPVACAKYHHQNTKRCIFCRHQQAKQAAAQPTTHTPLESPVV